jgi:signal peptidase II
VTQRRSTKAIAICVAVTALLLAADLGSKEWANGALSEQRRGALPPICGRQGYQRQVKAPIVMIEGYLEFQYAENCGAAFGIGNGWSVTTRRIVFIPAALAAAIALFTLFARGKGGPLFAWSVPLVVSGAVGNLIDRVRYGYVVDFIRFHLKETWSYPTFNVADIAIVVGVALLVLDGLRKDADKDKAASETAAPSEPEPRTGKKKKPKKKRERSESEARP